MKSKNKNFKIQKVENNSNYEMLTTDFTTFISTDLFKINDFDLILELLNNKDLYDTPIDYMFTTLTKNDIVINNINNNIIWFFLNNKQGWKFLTKDEKKFIQEYSVAGGHAPNYFQAKYNMLDYQPTK